MSGSSGFDKRELYDAVPSIADAVSAYLPTINPLFGSIRNSPDIVRWAHSFVDILISDSFDIDAGIELGKQLDLLDTVQPAELLRLQEIIYDELVKDLSHSALQAVYPTVVSAFTSVVCGYYIGKTHRSAAIDMSIFSRMGHDLKTPINAITGFSHVILREIDGPITQFQKEDLTSIHTAGKKLLTIINDITAMMKRDASRTGLYPTQFKMIDIIAEVLVDIQPFCAAANHHIIFRVNDDLGVMNGDISKIRWIILSILLFLTRQGTGKIISLLVEGCSVGEKDMVVFQLKLQQQEMVLFQQADMNQVSNTDMINRDVGLATCWRFCTSIGATLSMYEGESLAFALHIPSNASAQE